MNCPTCLSLMKCISSINPIPNQPGKNRMDLHCYNRLNPKDPNICQAKCHMGVITEDPKEWICHEYSFSFEDDNIFYYLRGHDKLIDPHYQCRPADEKSTSLLNLLGNELVKIDFIPISTSNDMHIEAWKLFRRLKNLIVYS